MSIPHLKGRAEFYALCVEHGEENVEWRGRSLPNGKWGEFRYESASVGEPEWFSDFEYQFRLRTRTEVLPEAVVPEEDPDGEYITQIRVGRWQDPYLYEVACFRHRNAEDRDAVVAAMLKREVKR